MRIVLREDSEGVASTVATLFTLLAVVLFMQAAIVAVVPAKQYEAERTTSVAAIAAFDLLRSAAAGAVYPGGQVTVTIPIGTPATSPFSSASPGDLRFNMGDATNANISVTTHDQGDVACATLVATSSISGSLSLSLATRQYPAQTLRLEAGGITVAQSVGTAVRKGMPVSFEPRPFGAGTLQVTLLTFTGPAFEATGTDYQFVTARFLQHSVGEQVIVRPDLLQQASDTGNITTYISYWQTQGAATLAGAKAVNDPLLAAQSQMILAQVSLTSSKLTPAKSNVDSAQNQLSAAINAAEQQVRNGQMQRWLATSAEDMIRRVACQISEWQDWYEGVKLTIQSPTAAAWAIWFDQLFRTTAALTSSVTSGTNTVLSVNAIDRFIIDERVIELSFA
jgi:hypothetical protein